MPQNRPATQPVSQGVGQTHATPTMTTGQNPLPQQATQQQPTPTMTTGHAPLPPTHNPNPIPATTPQPSNNSTIQQSTIQQSTIKHHERQKETHH
jgi:hypothetical protein